MASIATQRAVLTLSYVESLCMSIKEWYEQQNRQSLRLFSVLDRLIVESIEAIKLYPPVDPKDVQEMEVKMHYLNQEINRMHGTNATVGTAMVMGLLTDMRSYCKDGSPKAHRIDKMYALLKQAHTYFDRKGQKEQEYDKAWEAMQAYEASLEARVFRKISLHSGKVEWFLEFKGGKVLRVEKKHKMDAATYEAREVANG